MQEKNESIIRAAQRWYVGAHVCTHMEAGSSSSVNVQTGLCSELLQPNKKNQREIDPTRLHQHTNFPHLEL